MKDAIPSEDGATTKGLRAAGAVILGKAAMGEFAGGSYNSVRGQTLNPCNVKRATGGSSSGPGAAISANFSVLAVGTDTSTSVRGPASYTGIVGLRPTTGLISRAGIAPKNLNFDSAGPMARNVTDLALMMNVLAFPDPKDRLNIEVWGEVEKIDPTSKNGVDFTKALDRDALRGRRLGVLRDLFEGDPEINALAEKAIATMKDVGATMVDIRLDPAFIEAHLKSGIRKSRALSDYRFRQDWEQYLATFRSPHVPKTVAEFIKVYEAEVAPQSVSRRTMWPTSQRDPRNVGEGEQQHEWLSEVYRGSGRRSGLISKGSRRALSRRLDATGFGDAAAHSRSRGIAGSASGTGETSSIGICGSGGPQTTRCSPLRSTMTICSPGWRCLAAASACKAPSFSSSAVFMAATFAISFWPRRTSVRIAGDERQSASSAARRSARA
jgi:Asp-tRNA(Asn)/Glu-tRNA(Gln) amidotransferase A subunit family amidase